MALTLGLTSSMAGQMGFHHLDRGELAGGNRAGEVDRRPGAEIGGRMHRGKLHRSPAPMIRLPVAFRFVAGWLVPCAVLLGAEATAQGGKRGAVGPAAAPIGGRLRHPRRSVPQHQPRSGRRLDRQGHRREPGTPISPRRPRTRRGAGSYAGAISGWPTGFGSPPSCWTPGRGASRMPRRWTAPCPSCSRCRIR